MQKITYSLPNLAMVLCDDNFGFINAFCVVLQMNKEQMCVKACSIFFHRV